MSELNWWGLISRNWGKILGGLIALVFAILVINYGFWITIFIFLCVCIGILIGWRIDAGKEEIGRFFSRLFSSKND